MTRIRKQARRPWLLVLVMLCIVVAGLLLALARGGGSARATSGGSAYDIPLATDTNPAANIFETTIVANETTVDIGNGVTAHAQAFNGHIPGPTLLLHVGDTVIVHFENHLSERTAIHWHGIELENNMDGTPFTMDAVQPGAAHLYKFKVSRPGIYWYHPHHHASTDQVFKGLYGMIVVTDPNEASLPAGTLPSAADTRNIVLSDTTVCKAAGSNDAHTYDYAPPTQPWVGGPDLPSQVPDTPPVDLCENEPLDEDGGTGGPAFGNHDIPNIQRTGAARTNEGQTVLTNGKNVGGRAGSPHSFGPPIGALDPGAETLDVKAGQGLRLRLLDAATIRYFRLRLTDGAGTLIPLVRIGGEGGLLNQAVLDGNSPYPDPDPTTIFDTGYEQGEIVLAPGSRADVVAAIPPSATGDLTLWTEDYSRTGMGFSNIPTVPVMHLHVNGSVATPYTLAAGTALATHGTGVTALGPATGTLLDPGSFSPHKPGMAAQNIKLIATGGGVNIDGITGTHDDTAPYTAPPTATHPDSARYAKLGDTLQLSVTNMSNAHHPFHLHGFSMQPISLTMAGAPTYTWSQPEYADNIDIPGHYTLTFRIKLEDRPLADGVTMGGGLGRWLFHCHIFFHATLGMISEVVVTDANGNEAPNVDANTPETTEVNPGDTATMNGTFSDPDGDPVTLTASKGTVMDTGGGNWHWEHTASTKGFVYITATDSNGHKDQAVFIEKVTNQPPVASVGGPYSTVEGANVGLDASGSTDPNGDPLTYAWDLDNDGNFNDATGATPDFTAVGQDGVYPVHVQVTDPDGASDTASTTVTVANVPPSFSSLSSAPAAPENSPVGISGVLSDPGWLDPLTATVNWGDGTPVQPVSGVLENTRPDATLTFTALHTYGDDGSFVAQVCGSDDDTSTCQPVTVTISNVGPTAAIDKSGATIINGVPVIIGHSGSPVTFSGRTQDPGSDDLAATWHWGDGTPDTTTPYLNNPPFLDPHPSPTINPRNVTDTHTHTFGTACFYTSTFRSADDDSGLSPADSVNVVIVGNATDRLKANEWMDEFGKRTKPKLFSDAQLNCYLAIAGFVSSVFNEQRDASTIPAAYIVLKHDQPPLSQPLRDLDQELLAAWLNVANGSIGIGQLIDTDKNHQVDTPFSTVIANAEAVRNNPSSTDKQLHDQSDLLHRVNLGNA